MFFIWYITRMFLRPIWQQDSCFHLLPWVLFSLLYKHANQFQNKSEVGEKKKKHLSSFITKLSQYESSLPIPTACENVLAPESVKPLASTSSWRKLLSASGHLQTTWKQRKEKQN